MQLCAQKVYIAGMLTSQYRHLCILCGNVIVIEYAEQPSLTVSE